MRCISATGPSPSSRSLRAQIAQICSIDARVAVVDGDEVVAARGRSRRRGSAKQCSGAAKSMPCRIEVEIVRRRIRPSGTGASLSASSTASSWKWKTSDRIRAPPRRRARRGPPRRSTPLPGASQAGSTRSARGSSSRSRARKPRINLVSALDLQRRLRRRQPRHRHAVRRAAHVVEPDLLEEVDRGRDRRRARRRCRA